MSSHREAPAISKDPVADSADLYAFRPADNQDTVVIVANYVPTEAPAGGPNFYEFGDDVLYEIHVDNDGDADSDVTWQFHFRTEVLNPKTFLYNTGPINHISDSTWNRRQSYSVRRLDEHGNVTWSADNLACPPCNIGPRSTPDYATLAGEAVHEFSRDFKIFAGQRKDGFFVDLGSVFDLADLRPFQELHLIPSPAAPGVDTLKTANVHTIAIQVPINSLTRDGFTPDPDDVNDPRSVLGIWTTASRRRVEVRHAEADTDEMGPWVQVSRLGHPLINEVVIPMGRKDYWNAEPVNGDSQFVSHYRHPEVATLLPILYPGNTFKNLAALNASHAPRADLEAILLTGIPSGIISGFQNYTGSTLADMLRLNLAIPPASSSKQNQYGILGGDLAGYPNGRRVFDDVVTIELRAIAGLTYPLVASYTPDGAAGAIYDLTGPAGGSSRYQSSFPYLGLPHDGFHTPSK